MEMERENYKMHADVEDFQPPGSFRSGNYPNERPEKSAPGCLGYKGDDTTSVI